VYHSSNNIFEDALSETPSVKPIEIFLQISIHIFIVAVRMYATCPVFEVPDLDMQHLKVFPFVGELLF